MDSPRYAYAVIGLVLLLGGCGGGGTVFALKDPTYALKPTSVTVITGGSEESDLKLAEYLTQEFRDRTQLKVIGQEEVGQDPGHVRRTSRVQPGVDEVPPAS